MSLVDLIKSVADNFDTPEKTQAVTSVTSVTAVTSKKTNVDKKSEAQNDDDDLRMSWLVYVDGKPARVVGTRKRSYAEVLRSVQNRWPSYEVEVMK